MGTDASSRESIKRACALLGRDGGAGSFIILKLLPEPRGCCCFHCWPETWAEVNRHIAPYGPVPDEGDALVKSGSEGYVLECHESGPEVVIYLGVTTASLVLVKSVVDLFTTFLKGRQKEVSARPTRIRLTRRRVVKGTVEDDVLVEVEFPLSEDVASVLNESVRRALEKGVESPTSAASERPRDSQQHGSDG